MKRKIAVFTGTRAEYGLLYWLMKDIQASQTLELQVIVSAMHLSPEFGETWQQIELDGFKIDAKVEMLVSSDTSVGVVKSIGLGTIGFADALDRLRPEVLVVLGDRFEALAIVQAALVMRIPVAHIHGGEITEGAYDDAIRHSITKMASLHFAAAEPYRRRIIQMGENPKRVFNVGAIGLEHITRTKIISREELSAFYDYDFSNPFFLVTYHPETAAVESLNVAPLFEVLESSREYGLVFTYPNADNGSKEIIRLMEALKEKYPERVLLVKNFGIQRYLSVMRYSTVVIGNSSSGFSEAPALLKPVVNIGDRQKGRLRCELIVDTVMDRDAIETAIVTAIAFNSTEALESIVPPLGFGGSCSSVISILKSFDGTLKRGFYDI